MGWKAVDFKNTSTACFTAFFFEKKGAQKGGNFSVVYCMEKLSESRHRFL